MLYTSLVASALCAVALSAPTVPSAPQAGMKTITNYFNLLASKVAASKGRASAPVCDLSKAVFPIASPTPLPSPSSGLILKHVAIGRGTQNYTCTSDATLAPIAIGAIATLYNASCIASTYPDLLSALPGVALQFNLTSPTQQTLTPSNLLLSGHHFFSNLTTPAFDMEAAVGFAPCSKNNSVVAPTGAMVGQGNVGLGAVPWLKLVTRTGATEGLEEVYRLNTAGGVAPATCAGMASTFEIQYAAEYWFFGSA